MQLWKGFWGFRWRLRPTVHGVLVVGAVALPLLLTYLPDDQKWLSALLTAVAAVGGGLATNVIEKWRRRSSLSMQGDARRCYLRGLRRECQLLPLAALGGDEGLDETLTLEQVYIALDTTMVPADSKTGEVVDRTSREDVFVRSSHRETVPLSARAALATSPWLAILGDPGGGKSTFVRRILAEMATGQELGTPPAPDLPGDLPVLINLRNLDRGCPRWSCMEYRVGLPLFSITPCRFRLAAGPL